MFSRLLQDALYQPFKGVPAKGAQHTVNR